MTRFGACGRSALGVVMIASLVFSGEASAKKKAAAKQAQASEQTARAISELAGKFKWGMTPEEVTALVIGDIQKSYDDRVKAESNPARQDAVRQEMNKHIDQFKASYIKFDGQKTGWDVSVVDREFGHKNSESMMVMWEKQQRRYLFFYDDKLWKQFIAFDAENPKFAGKTFDDFADVIQARYGQSMMTFRKQRTSDNQMLDHLEWAPAGDYLLWAIDLTQFYGNFCLSLMQPSVMKQLEEGRRLNSPQRASSANLVDQVIKSDGGKDPNIDIVDSITGHNDAAPAPPPTTAQTGKGKKGSKGKASEPDKPAEEPTKTADPLEGTTF